MTGDPVAIVDLYERLAVADATARSRARAGYDSWREIIVLRVRLNNHLCRADNEARVLAADTLLARGLARIGEVHYHYSEAVRDFNEFLKRKAAVR